MPVGTPGSVSILSSHFTSIPWCAEILGLLGTITFVPVSRAEPSDLPQDCSPSQNQFFKYTLDNHAVVPKCIGFYREPKLASERPELPFMFQSASLIFDIRSGVNGFNGTTHGGFITTLIDEAIGSFIFQNDVVNRDSKKRGVIPPLAKDFIGVGYATARMDVAYRRPLPTPRTVIVAVSLQGLDGRKAHIYAVVKGEDGEEYAVGDAIWIRIQGRRL